MSLPRFQVRYHLRVFAKSHLNSGVLDKLTKIEWSKFLFSKRINSLRYKPDTCFVLYLLVT